MKTLLAAAALTLAVAVPAWAQMGNIAGTESRGAPLNNSVHKPSIDPNTGHMPGYRSGARAHAKYYVKKKKRPYVSGSASTGSSTGY